jgi:flagellar hook assembly protein FlgD
MNLLRVRRGALVVAAAVVGTLVSGPVDPVGASVATVAKPSPLPVIFLDRKMSPEQYLSPNGDGAKDRVPVTFRLRAKARVSVVIRPLSSDDHSSALVGVATKEVVRRADVGIRKGGPRTWWWAGRDDDGEVVDDGAYEITVRAKPLTKKGAAGSITQVVDSHTSFHVDDDDGPRITLTRATIYPDTTEITDRVRIWANEPRGGRWDPMGSTPVLTITDAAGREVRRQSYPAAFSWDGTDASGTRVPNGTYTVRADWSDTYGNRLSRSVTIVVAPGSLVRQTWSRTYDDPHDALATNGAYQCYEPELDCYTRAVARPSTRFATGLSFGPRSAALFITQFPLPAFDPTLDQARVSVTGGPAAAGDLTSTGTLSLLGTTTVVPPGDGTTASAWSSLATARPGELTWGFGSDVGGYDVDSFTVEVVHWAPPAQVS